MLLGFDPVKSARNATERDLPFELAAELEWARAVIYEDERFDYGETRMIALAPLRGRLHVVCYCERGEVRWIISFRKANRREIRAHARAFGG